MPEKVSYGIFCQRRYRDHGLASSLLSKIRAGLPKFYTVYKTVERVPTQRYRHPAYSKSTS